MIEIDTIRRDDLPQLSSLYEELTGGIPGDVKNMENIFSQMNAAGSYILLVAREDGALAGSVMGVLCMDLAAGCRPFLVIENLIVRKESRGKGIATMLLNELERRARGMNCWYMLLVSGAARREAHVLYERLGYAEEKVRGFRKHL